MGPSVRVGACDVLWWSFSHPQIDNCFDIVGSWYCYHIGVKATIEKTSDLPLSPLHPAVKIVNQAPYCIPKRVWLRFAFYLELLRDAGDGPYRISI